MGLSYSTVHSNRLILAGLVVHSHVLLLLTAMDRSLTVFLSRISTRPIIMVPSVTLALSDTTIPLLFSDRSGTMVLSPSLARSRILLLSNDMARTEGLLLAKYPAHLILALLSELPVRSLGMVLSISVARSSRMVLS
jgi:hypothetical protein